MKLEDGTFKIEGVEIFKLGPSKGLDYNHEWFARAQFVHEQFSSKGWLPSIIVGHTGWFAENEKPEIGTFDNIRLAEDNSTVVADYLIEDEDTLKLFNQFPHRSVEVYHGEAYFSRVAQLGATEPYFKFPPLKIAHFSSENPQSESIEYERGDDDFSTPEPNSAASAANAPNQESATTDFLAERAELERARAQFEKERAEMAAQLAEFRKQKLSSQLEQLDAEYQTHLSMGLNKPFAEKFRDLRKSLITAEAPLEFQVTDSNGNTSTANVRQMVNQFAADLLKHLKEQTLTVKLEGNKLPFLNDTPGLLPEGLEDKKLSAAEEFERDRVIKNHLRDKFGFYKSASEDPVHGWTHADFKKAEAELISSGTIC